MVWTEIFDGLKRAIIVSNLYTLRSNSKKRKQWMNAGMDIRRVGV